MMTPSFRIRRARVDELAQLPEIERAAGAIFVGRGISDEALAHVTPVEDFCRAHEAALLWVAADDGDAPIGFARVELLDDEPHLEEIDVAPKHARQGIGRALIEEICRWARAAGYAALTLTTFRDLPWNAPYYARLGFRELESAGVGPELAARVAEEAAHGLDPVRRIVMARRLNVE